MYVGPLTSHTMAVALVSEGKQFYEDIMLAPALRRILIELACNAADNVAESRREKILPGSISFTLDKYITVTNEGRPIPVEKMIRPTGETDWIPSVMFSKMFASSHYDDSQERDTAGVYGVGAKMCNSLSSFFSVLVRDGKNEFYQEWKRGKEVAPAKVKKCTDGCIVSITFSPDMSKFEDSVSLQDNPKLVRKIAADIALFARVPVHFTHENKKETFDYSNSISPALELRGATRHITLSHPNHKCWIFYNKTCTIQESYVNSTPTYTHGTHVNALIKAIKNELKKKKGFNNVKKNIIMACFSFVLCSTIDRPAFDGACKDKLSTKIPVFNWDNMLASMENTLPDLLERAKAIIDSKHYKSLNGIKISAREYQHSTRKVRGVRPRRLWISEGISAAATVLNTIMSLYGNREYDGILAIRGKTLNVRNKEIEDIVQNVVIGKIITAMNIQVGADYRDPKVRASLRYDELVIAADADLDGNHIRCLLLDLMKQLVPDLIVICAEEGKSFIYSMQSAYMRLMIGEKRFVFYNLEDWEAWVAANPTGWSKKYLTYCKGLGSSGPMDIARDVQQAGEDKILTPISFPDGSEQALSLAFDKRFTDLRKEWMMGDIVLPIEEEESVPTLIQRDLLPYARQTLKRAIPGLDGFNECQRLGLWSVLTQGGGKSDAVLGDVLKRFNYKHNIKALYEAVSGMSAGYPGTNNIPFFSPEGGNFGSRSQLGKDRGGSRYTEIALRPFVRYIFRKEDDHIMQRKHENGNDYEPLCLLPIIPTWLVNGTGGISTGWNTFIPCYNPKDVIRCLKSLTLGEELKQDGLVPWYRHFKGTITLKTIRQDQEEEDVNGNTWVIKKGEQAVRIAGKKSVTTKDGVTEINITEIPPYVSTLDYIDALKEVATEYKQKEPNNHGSANTIDIRFTTKVPIPDNRLKLSYTNSLSNMNLLGDDGVPITVRTPEGGLLMWYKWRIEGYRKRKASELAATESALAVERDYYHFLKSVLDKKFNPNPGNDIDDRGKYVLWLTRKGYTLEAADRYKVYHRQDHLDTVKVKIEQLTAKRDAQASRSVEEMFRGDLEELEEQLNIYYSSEIGSCIDILSVEQLQKLLGTSSGKRRKK